METEFIYWKHDTPVGVRVEEVCGAEDRSGRIWREMALQIYCEHGTNAYREIGHYANGAPYLEDSDARISITHTDHLLAVASLPRTPDIDLAGFSPRTAMGIDAERADREQVLKVRERYLSPSELAIVDETNLLQNVVAWTCKEALYKAALADNLDWRTDYEILSLPNPADGTMGKGVLHLGEKGDYPMDLYSYESEGCIVSIALSPKCAKFKGNTHK